MVSELKVVLNSLFEVLDISIKAARKYSWHLLWWEIPLNNLFTPEMYLFVMLDILATC
jgi:hypothetical protein